MIEFPPFLQGITRIYLYNVDPLKPHFYIVKLGLTGIYIIFLISAFEQKYEKKKKNISESLFENFQFFGCEIFNIFE